MNMLRKYRQHKLWMWSLPLQTLHTHNRSLNFFYKPRLKGIFKELKLEFSFSVESFYIKWVLKLFCLMFKHELFKWVLKLQPLRRTYWAPSMPQWKPISGTRGQDCNLWISCCPSLLLMVLFTLTHLTALIGSPRLPLAASHRLSSYLGYICISLQRPIHPIFHIRGGNSS